jgi:ABC-type branched-subunit amino acid transport system ATPase component
MTQSSAAITARGIRKSFGEHTVLDDVDLEVDQGTIFALLGPNGAGKTTIVRILSTLIPADAGTIRVAGHDLATDPDGVRARDRRDRPVLRGRQPAHRRGEPAAEDPVEFAEAFLRNYPAGQWITRVRERLTRSIERAAGEDTANPGRSR